MAPLPSGLDHVGMGTERFEREKPCFTGIAMNLRLAATGAVGNIRKFLAVLAKGA